MPIIGRNRTFNHGDQFFRRDKRMAFTRMNNGTSNPPRKPFFAELEDRVGQLCLRPSVDQVSCGPAHRLVHTHVQRTISLKAKPASGLFQLRGRNSKIKQDSIDSPNTTGSKMLFQTHEVTIEETNTVPESREPVSTRCYGCCVTVKSYKPAIWTSLFKKFFSMPTISHCTVKIDSGIFIN